MAIHNIGPESDEFFVTFQPVFQRRDGNKSALRNIGRQRCGAVNEAAERAVSARKKRCHGILNILGGVAVIIHAEHF